uniref:Hypothetical transmembrane protein n=1 Tax=uncultured delta proteobacterium DeepAnt-32C6 TaxID=357895 RepID=Q2I6L1_9DELT|nr:Hypothetical transmembrane protein [uncultured delta proteobacterium DeepAnt-32C6]
MCPQRGRIMDNPQAVALQKIDCPGCGAALDIASGVGRGQASCRSCGGVIDLASPDYRLIAQMVNEDFQPRSAIRLGLEARFHGKIFRVIGRMRYHDSAAGWYWEEWFLVANDGSILYLEEDGRDFRLLTPFTPREAPDKASLESSTELFIDGRPWYVRERGNAVISHFEGQLPWKVKIDTEVTFLDAGNAQGQRLSVEWTRRELEFYSGESLSHATVARRFGLSTIFPKGVPRSDDEGEDWGETWEGDTPEFGALGVGVAIVIVILLVFLAFAMDDCNGCVYIGGGGGHYPGGGGGWGK